MKIAIVGTGHIARALAGHWLAAGHSVILGSRHAEGENEQDGVPVRAVVDAVADSEAVALAIPGGAAVDSAKELAALLAGKTVVLPANDTKKTVANIAKAIAEAAPGALVVRAFNTVAAETIAAPAPDGSVKCDLFYAAEPAAEAAAEQLIAECGFRPVRVGGIDKAPLVDGIFDLWVALAFGRKLGRGISINLGGA
ncbi:hypothetical protein DFJ74DRAFT_642843 [Hyaloraphidium curvatum]|nr:hypothetical protein DFJ74DRAFT_642843 [Hyaloraphidium curvatum]